MLGSSPSPQHILETLSRQYTTAALQFTSLSFFFLLELLSSVACCSRHETYCFFSYFSVIWGKRTIPVYSISLWPEAEVPGIFFTKVPEATAWVSTWFISPNKTHTSLINCFMTTYHCTWTQSTPQFKAYCLPHSIFMYKFMY